MFQDEANIYELPTPSRSAPDNHSLNTAPTIQKSSSLVGIKNKLSDDWKCLVNNPELSDLEIRCEDGNVPAHRLVFHVRCPEVLQHANQDNGRTVIVLKSCLKIAAVAMLEFVYAGSLRGIFQLDKEDFKSLCDVVDKLDFSELKHHLRRLDKTQEKFSGNESKSGNFKQELFGAVSKSQNDLCGIENLSPYKNISAQANQSKSFESNSETFPELCPSIDLESSGASCGRESPDMFGESNIMENKSFSHQTQDDLDILASLLGKSTGVIEGKFDEPELSKVDCSQVKNSLTIVSPSGSLVNDSSSGKRKALESSDSEEPSLSKRPCSDWSKKATSDNSGEDVFDLTQNSNSNEDIIQDNCKDVGTQLCQNKEVSYLSKSNSCEILDDSMEDLTQKDPSVPSSPQNISSTTKKTPESQNKSVYQDYFEPAWDGYDDYLHFNYSPITTPGKPLVDESIEKERSQNLSTQKSSQFSCLKTNVQESLSLTPKISSDVNYISSDSNSPKQSSQKVIDEYSWKSNVFDSKNLTSPKYRVSRNSKKIAPGTITKPRKNLSFQFDNPIDSPTHFSPALSPNTKFSQTSNLSEKSLESSPHKSDNNLIKSPLRRNSLVAMQRLLDDSFDVNDSVLARADAILEEEAKCLDEHISPLPSTSNQSKIKRNENAMMTPTPEIIASDTVTPLPDYSAMKTPSLKVRFTNFKLLITL